jgi:hypothetical protein
MPVNLSHQASPHRARHGDDQRMCHILIQFGDTQPGQRDARGASFTKKERAVH